MKRKKDTPPLKVTDDEELEDIHDIYFTPNNDENSANNGNGGDSSNTKNEHDDHNELERLKIQYDILKQKLMQKNKLLQLLLGLVAAFVGSFEITFCLCKNSCNGIMGTVLNIICIVFTAIAIALIAKGLCCSDDKNLENLLNEAKAYLDIKDFLKYYNTRIRKLNDAIIKKERFVKRSIASTVVAGIVALGTEIATLVLSLI